MDVPPETGSTVEVAGADGDFESMLEGLSITCTGTSADEPCMQELAACDGEHRAGENGLNGAPFG